MELVGDARENILFLINKRINLYINLSCILSLTIDVATTIKEFINVELDPLPISGWRKA